jgi:hypothetical protein
MVPPQLLFHNDGVGRNLSIHIAEAMNPAKRSNMEDRCVLHRAGEWPFPCEALKDFAMLAVYDGHGVSNCMTRFNKLDRRCSFCACSSVP